MRRGRMTITLLAALVSTATMFAGENRERLAGTVTKVEKGRIEIKGTDGKPVAVALVAGTTYAKGKAPATLADVRPGMKAEIEATRSPKALTAGKVRVAAPEAVYTCPMHPKVQQPKPGRCPKCGMNLEKKA